MGGGEGIMYIKQIITSTCSKEQNKPSKLGMYFLSFDISSMQNITMCTPSSLKNSKHVAYLIHI